MRIETTLYMNIVIKSKIELVSESLGVGSSVIIVKLMERLMKDHGNMTRQWCSIKYQQKSTEDKWRRKHISLKPEEYEFFIDMRKFYKKSVSFLVAVAVNLYLDELFKQLSTMEENSTDNYSLISYSLTKEISENSILWTICWGVSKKPANRSL